MLSPSDHLKIKKDKKLILIGKHINRIPSTISTFLYRKYFTNNSMRGGLKLKCIILYQKEQPQKYLVLSFHKGLK